jgi:Protein of unknown function (DUF1501)
MHDNEYFRARRHFLTKTSGCLGMAAVASLLNPRLFADEPVVPTGVPVPGVLGRTHFAPRAKNVINLFMAGGPSHIDLFDHKPILRERHGLEMPASVLGEQRVTLMTRNQGHFQAASTPYRFRRVGRAGHEMSELFRHLPAVADELCIIKSVHTEPINHDPAIVFMQAGVARSGMPCMGSWVSYGLGSENRDLPAFVVMISGPLDQPLSSRHYHSGFLPAQHQGVQFQSAADPVLYLTSPDGISREVRAGMIDGINDLNRLHHARVGDPEIEARIRCFELAFRMQTSVPELVNIANEPERVLDGYGPDVHTPGSFARHCLLARRLVERGVRFVQLFHRGWDQHAQVVNDIRRQAQTVDQPYAALLRDLKQRGMLDDTLVIWGGEFGRTAYGQGNLSGGFGRDHHPRCFTYLLAGGGVKAGLSYGSTDDFGYNIAEKGVHVNDLHATILHCLGINHERLTFRYGGRDFRLTDVAGNVVRELLA